MSTDGPGIFESDTAHDVRSSFRRLDLCISRWNGRPCHDISVRDDKQRGPFVLAFGLKNVHSLELRKVQDEFELELWHGATYDVEFIANTLRLKTPDEALETRESGCKMMPSNTSLERTREG